MPAVEFGGKGEEYYLEVRFEVVKLAVVALKLEYHIEALPSGSVRAGLKHKVLWLVPSQRLKLHPVDGHRANVLRHWLDLDQDCVGRLLRQRH
eukprot:scaffold229278_cov31-Prasinocladus_malaysianus.AAC.5